MMGRPGRRWLCALLHQRPHPRRRLRPTPAPATPSPVTPAPATPSSPTAAPATPSPPTPAPATPSSPTAAPATPSPPTPPPATQTPATPVPATAAPAVLSRRSDDETAVTDDDQHKIATGAAMASSLVGGAAGSALRMVFAANVCRRGGAEWSAVVHPTRAAFLGNDEAGMVLANTGLMGAVWLVLRGAACVLDRIVPAPLEGRGMLRFPSLPVFAMLILYNGVAAGSLTMVMRGDPAGFIVIGAGALVLCSGIPYVLLRFVARELTGVNLSRPPAEYVIDRDATGWRGRLMTFLCGPGEWVNRHPTVNWTGRHSFIIRGYRPSWAGFMAVDFLASLATAGLIAVAVTTRAQCGYRKLFLGVLFLMFASVGAWLRPCCKARDNVCVFGSHAFEGLGLVIRGVGFMANPAPPFAGFLVADGCSLAGLALLVIKACFDCLAVVYVWCSGRRVRIAAQTEPSCEEMRAVEPSYELEAIATATSAFDTASELCDSTSTTHHRVCLTEVRSPCALPVPSVPLQKKTSEALPTPRLRADTAYMGRRSPRKAFGLRSSPAGFSRTPLDTAAALRPASSPRGLHIVAGSSLTLNNESPRANASLVGSYVSAPRRNAESFVGSPRVGTPRVGTPRVGTPRAKVSF
eukprot:TRINITY_DN1928_c1_g1_i8.p1 TRINITY_DN1928_c1_g1~~TRINITY_DN1928_c1_g1_i8.p1  ORF type:complete len:636 (+),score=34.37 TRINITY_DN1928_c1_g1_i8:91-1998(+)